MKNQILNILKNNALETFLKLSLIAALSLTGCEKFITVEAPITSVNAGTVYQDDQTAIASLTGIYSLMSQDGHGAELSLNPGLSADEFTLWSGISSSDQVSLYKNDMKSTEGLTGTIWSRLYRYIYYANAAIEGLNKSTFLTPAVRNQLLGEAYFIRAYCYFYLFNLYGDVPLALTTDFEVNSKLSRSTKVEVYQQMKTDCMQAQSLMLSSYVDASVLKSTTERTRPNKFVATALLARICLYKADYADAEIQSTALISNISTFDTLAVANVFLKNSKETIWALQPVTSANQINTREARTFTILSSGPSSSVPAYLSSSLLNSFEPNDKRRANWVGNITALGIIYYYPAKYKATTSTTSTEYSVVFRLAEQYLIRAEARANQNNLSGALSDLNGIRKRAGLAAVNPTTQMGVMLALLKERQTELFSEWGQRWFDLKRSNTVDAAMKAAAVQKGSTWSIEKALYPLPLTEIQRGINLVQNPSY